MRLLAALSRLVGVLLVLGIAIASTYPRLAIALLALACIISICIAGTAG